MAAVAAVAAIGSLGYGIYAGERAQAEQKREYAQAQADAKAQQAQQAALLQDQQAKSQALSTQQSQEQKDAFAAQQALQQNALTTAQGQIPINQKALSDSLIASEQQAQTAMNPALEARLNALGLLNSGALPAQQAIQQANLDSQRQQALTQYGVNANSAIQNQALGYAGNDASFLQNNLNTTLNNEQNSLQSQFNNQMTGYQNDVAQSQYLGGLQSSINAGQQQQANQFINLGGQLGGGALNYFGKQSAQTPISPVASSSGSAASYFAPSTGYTGGGAPYSYVPSGSQFGDLTGQSSQPGQSYGMFDSFGNYIPQQAQSYQPYTPYTGGI